MTHASDAAAGLAARLDASLRRLGAPQRVLVAVSGGADSIALLHLLADLGRHDLVAATVDHGLRPEARREAVDVANVAAARSVPHRILTWAGDKPQSGLQDAARRARYALLCAAAEKEGCAAIVTAHSADDQAETAFMRLSRGAGPAGLAAMRADVPVAAGAGTVLRLLRPLLPERRATLREYAQARGAVFFDDPSNDDPHFERVRARALLGALEEQGLLTVDALCAVAERAAAAADDIAATEGRVFARCGGWFSASGAAALEAPAHVSAAPGLAARLIRAVSGADYAPDAAAAREAFAAAQDAGGATLGGALLRREGARLVVMREPAALLGRDGAPPLLPLRLAAGAEALWDKRFVVRSVTSVPAEIRPCGPDNSDEILRDPRLGREAALTTPVATPPGAIVTRSLVYERFFRGVLRYEA